MSLQELKGIVLHESAERALYHDGLKPQPVSVLLTPTRIARVASWSTNGTRN